MKDFAGTPAHKSRNDFAEGRAAAGRKIQVVFKDGETLAGTTQGYQPGRPGFVMVPADPDANTERCYVVAAATKSITLL